MSSETPPSDSQQGEEEAHEEDAGQEMPEALVAISTEEGVEQKQTTLSALNSTSATGEGSEDQQHESNEQEQAVPSSSFEPAIVNGVSSQPLTQYQLVYGVSVESSDSSHTPPSPLFDGPTHSLPLPPEGKGRVEDGTVQNESSHEKAVPEATQPVAVFQASLSEASDKEVPLAAAAAEKKVFERNLIGEEVETHPLLWQSQDKEQGDTPTRASDDQTNIDQGAIGTTPELTKESSADQRESSVDTKPNLQITNTAGANESQSSTSSSDDLPSFAQYPSLPSSSENPPTSPAQQDGQMFSGVIYLGSSTVDAPVSEAEANRMMSVLKQQAGQPMPVILFIPVYNSGDIVLIDPDSKHFLAAYPIRYVLFCARGRTTANLNDCFGFNVLHRKSGVYHCHVFRCKIPEEVSPTCSMTPVLLVV